MRRRRERNAQRFRLLFQIPIPLVSEDLGLALLASPKAGFTFASKWFFDHVGLLQDALQYHPFVHIYRNKVYNLSPEAKQSLEALARHRRRFVVVKMVRDPYDRAVSSYIHANKSSYEDEAIQRHVGRSWDEPSGRAFSFREFVSYLSTIDLNACNPHHALQTHKAERAGIIVPDHVVRLEDALDRLPEIETELGLAHVDLSQYRSSPHHTHRLEAQGFAGDEAWNFPRKRVQAPPSRAFYDDELSAQVAALYREDFERYGFRPGCFSA